MPQAHGDSTCPDWRTEEATGECPQKARKMTGNCPKGDRGRMLQSVSAKVLRHRRASCVLEMTLNQSYVGKKESRWGDADWKGQRRT